MNTETHGHLAPLLTYIGGGSAVLFWGLHVSDICAIVGATCSVIGVALQILARRRKGDK